MTTMQALQDATDEVRPSEFSDDTLALVFTDEHINDLRYVHKWGQWLRWDGKRWAEDKTLTVFDSVRDTCREQARRANDPRVKGQLSSGKTVAAVHRLAQMDQRTAGTVDQWDADPLLLNTPGGVVDLRTGTIRDALPTDFMTKATAVSPGGECPRFIKFLDEIFAGDAELTSYMQRMAGYCLTGSTNEHAMFFCYGTGANGKSTLLNTVAGIMGDYHRTASIETFTVSHGERHPTELAGLQGARLVTVSETEKGRAWAESRIKQLTGDDPVEARFMRQDFFVFQPQFKLAISGNHKPVLKTVDEAIRRRFNLLPFLVTVPAEKRDDELPDKLKKEWPGILKWMIDGCVAWQKGGLQPPAAVTDATTEYLDDQDLFGQWMDERCVADKSVETPSTKLFASWKTFAELNNEHVGSQKALSGLLKTKFKSRRTMNGTVFCGVRARLMSEDTEP